MKLLFTGASGFLGTNTLNPISQSYEVTTIGRISENDIQADLSSCVPKLPCLYDVVLHAAGKAHSVPRTQAEKEIFHKVNVEGTKNLCRALEQTGIPRSIVFVSTVAVYGCNAGENITENHPLNGTTPYAQSKIQAEEFLTTWCTAHHVTLGVIRPSLIAGPNPPGNLGAMIRGIQTGRYVSIAGGKARKSVLMVQDIANLLPLLTQRGGIYNVCDSYNPTFRELEEVICSQLRKKLPVSIPGWLATSMAKVGDCLGSKAPINTMKLRKITEPLTFSNQKAIRLLGWKPSDVLHNFKIE